MKNDLETNIEILSKRVRLFIEHTQNTQGRDQLTEREIVFMEFLDHKGSASFSDLSGFFKKISPSTVSNILKKLHRKKFISRQENPEDLRSNIFSLTTLGRRFLAPVKMEQAQLSRIIAESLQLTSDEIDPVNRVFERAIIRFDQWLGFVDEDE